MSTPSLGDESEHKELTANRLELHTAAKGHTPFDTWASRTAPEGALKPRAESEARPRPQLRLEERDLLPFATASTVTRLAVVMIPTALLLTALAVGISPTDSGALIAAYSVGAAVGAPTLARLMRAFGDARVILVSGTASGMLLVLAVAIVPRGVAAVSLPIVLALGLLTPPVGALARTVLTRLPLSAERRSTAFSVDTLMGEALYLLGPALVSMLLLVVADSAALSATACLLAGGSLLTGRSRLLRRYGGARHVSDRSSNRPGRWSARLRFGCMMAAVGLGGAYFGALEIGIAEAFVDLGFDSSWAGLVFAAVAVGSICGGLIFMRRPLVGSPLRCYRLLLLGTIATGLLPASLFVIRDVVGHDQMSVVLLLMALAAAGLPIAACGAEEHKLIADVASTTSTLGAFSVATSAVLVGLGGGSFLGGMASTMWPPSGFLILPSALLTTAFLFLLPLGARKRSSRDHDQIADVDASSTGSGRCHARPRTQSKPSFKAT